MNAAFPVRSSDYRLVLLFVDFKTGQRVKLGASDSHLLSPHLSVDGARLLFVRQLFRRGGFELISCETSNFDCHRVLKTEQSIESPIDLTGERILYVSSPYVVAPDGRGRFSRNDFWIVDHVGKSRKLTNFQLYQIRSVSASEHSLYFSAEGEGHGRRIFPKQDPLAKEDSSIFVLPFDEERGSISEPNDVLHSLFSAGGRATNPAVSRDGLIIAFLRTPAGLTNYRCDLVVRRNGVERRFESSAWGFSQPVVVGADVLTNEITSDRHVIKRATADETALKTIVSIFDSSFDSTTAIDLKIR
jgi:hypothetical protein